MTLELNDKEKTKSNIRRLAASIQTFFCGEEGEDKDLAKMQCKTFKKIILGSLVYFLIKKKKNHELTSMRADSGDKGFPSSQTTKSERSSTTAAHHKQNKLYKSSL
jgi:hypothetical protein